MVHYLDDMDSKIQGFGDIIAREGDNGSDWTGITPLFNRPLYKNTRQDVEESLPQASTPPRNEGQGRPPGPGPKKAPYKPRPLTSSLGEALQGALKETKPEEEGQ